MKYSIVAALLLALPFSSSAQEVSDDTDRFSGARLIKYTGPTAFGRPSIAAAIMIKNGDVRPSLAISVSNREWQYLRCHGVRWLVDGKPLNTEETIHSGTVRRGSVAERIVQPFTEEQFKAIGSANVVEYKV